MDGAIQEAKKSLRKQLLQCRDGLTEEERSKSSRLVTEQILAHPWYGEADRILGFVSFGSEIDTKGILRDALLADKKVYVPKIEYGDEGKKMLFYRIRGLDELQAGFHGILEPAGTSECYDYPEDSANKTLMLMPGVAFDRKGNRMGYGGGFYDRFLEDKEALRMRTIAIGFACQMVDRVPAGEQDVKPVQIICA